MVRDVVVLPVRYAAGPVATQATTRALTQERVFIRSMAAPCEGVRLQLRLYLPFGAPEDLDATVTSRPAPEGEKGFWADFDRPSPDARMRIAQLLQPPRLQADPRAPASEAASRAPAPQAIAPAPLPHSASRTPARLPDRTDPDSSAGRDRATLRFDAALRVRFETLREVAGELAINVSAGGMFVRTDRPPQLLELVVLTIELPGEPEPVRVRGQVVHRVTREEGRMTGRRAGAGIQFIEADDRFREQLDAYLARQDAAK